MSRSPSLDEIHDHESGFRSVADALQEPHTSDKEYQLQVFEFYKGIRDMLKTKLHKTHEEAERLMEDNLHHQASLSKDLHQSDHHATTILEKFQVFFDDLSQTLQQRLKESHIDESRRLVVQEVLFQTK